MSDKHDFITALQYLYYVQGDSPWRDFEYDAYCREHKICGIGGSDRDKDYSSPIKQLARCIHANPENYKWRKVDRVNFVATSDGWLPVDVAPDRKAP